MKGFFSKCDQIRSFLWIWLHLLKKSLMENFIFCAALFVTVVLWFSDDYRGHRSLIIRLNSHNLRSQIWRRYHISKNTRSTLINFIFSMLIQCFFIVTLNMYLLAGKLTHVSKFQEPTFPCSRVWKTNLVLDSQGYPVGI